ncbi:Alpha/beta hydrolase family protein [Aspergillus parasiticus SU-1]|uniref:Alpha/Beta hydrolase protein n=3 Tax=Aspergillus subgen. Circumdati TaxID=2720871 RepID=A0A5N6DY69_ASPPA|nr:Alpha/Beta hydrolase protein [Aspergillus parasiticus]KAB8223100.1 Alpha/Beta hydrolase protein [Aspergillus novoparasiticus]KJK61648.1 Alpha/beta hydrolase family protein [Aspergillus parasiticus SU-1]
MSESPPPPPSWSITNMANSAAQYLRLPVLASSGLAVVASGLLYFKQNELIYPRNVPTDARTFVPKPRQFGVNNYEELQIPTPDGESLHALFLRPSKKGFAGDITVLMFHGNAGNIGHRIPIARVLLDILGCNVLMLEYRGYGLSTGVPDEAGLKIDAQTGLDYIRQRAETSNNKVIVYGQSLGGAVAINLVAENQDKGDIGGLILENTFLSIRKLIPTVFPPARYLARFCHQYWTSEEILPKITKVPILFLSGLKDEIVPPSNMTQLFAICQSERKVWRTLPNGAHNDSVAEPGYFEHIHSFIKEEVIDQD